MGFGENFVEGYTRGMGAKRAREQTALQREEFDQRKQEAAQRFKLDSDEAKARRDQQTLNEKLALINIQKMTPAALPDTSHVGPGGVGPPEEKDFPAPPPSIGLDAGGQHIEVPGTNLEAEQARGLDLKRAEDEIKDVTLSGDIPELELKKGQRMSAEELTARAHALAARTAERAARIRAENMKPQHMTLLNPSGRRTAYWVYPDGTRTEIGPAPLNATSENRADAATALISQGSDITGMLKRPEISKTLGPVMGRFNNLREFIGNPPPEFAELAGEIESFALANMGVHGMRSVQGAEKIQKLLNGKHTPESLAAGIDGLLNFSRKFVQTTRPGTLKPTAEEELNAFLVGDEGGQ